jgi:hypothetical protein
MMSPLVILLEVHTASVTVFEFKRDAPWSVDMDRIAGWSKAPQRMKIKTWEVHFLRPHDDIQTVKPPQNAPMHFGIDFTGPPKLPKLGKTLAFEALDRITKRKLNDDKCQLLAYIKNEQPGLSTTKL